MKRFENFDLTNFNSYRIHAICREVFFPEHEDDFIKIFSSNVSNNLIIIGGGYNIILSKAYYEQSFVIIDEHFSKTLISENIMIAQAGASMQKLSEYALNAGLSGLEMFYDIPGSLGGAVVMNAGAGGREIKDVLLKVRLLDLEDMAVKELEKSGIGFSYRNSIFQGNQQKLVLKAWLKLLPGDSNEIESAMNTIKQQRWAKQPRNYPNAGSVFKRPPGYYVGALIEELGLKGFTVGGAKISEKHGGFIINFKNATGKDILDIIFHVQRLVLEKYNINLEIEQRII